MEIDLEHVAGGLSSGSPLQAEVCVVGGGIAGLLLTQRLAEQGIHVLLVEAGDRTANVRTADPTGATQGLGGTSATWGGQLLPVRSLEGWPIQVEEIAPFYGEIERILGVDSLPYDAGAFLEALGTVPPPRSSFLSSFALRMSKFAPFTKRNLGLLLGRALLAHPRVRVALRAAATSLELTADGSRVQQVRVRTASGKVVKVIPREVVVAAGTVETCRLLLVSRSVMPEGIGNDHYQVGRRFHNHLTVRAAEFHGRARAEVLRRFRPWVVGGLRGTVYSLKFESEPRSGNAAETPNGMAHFTFEEPEGTGAAALREGLRRWQKRERPARLQATQLASGLRALAALTQEAHAEGRRWISETATVSLQLNVAQQVSPASRVRLGAEPDPFGQPRAVLERHVSEQDREGLRTLAREMHRWLEGSGRSRADGAIWNADLLQGADEIPGLDDARHAMGGACMGSAPKDSVVGPDLRVHGIRNLWIASAAVFPDGRAQLPTLTLMALSLRLADRLHAALARGR